MALILSLLLIFGATSFVIATSRRTCTVPYGDGTTDDSPAILKVFQDCNTNSVITFASGVKYNAWSPMSWKNLKDVVIELNGSLHLPNNIAAVQAKVKANTTPNSSWFYIQGTDVSLIGQNSESLDGGSFYGYGQQWWAIGQKTNRPRVVMFHVTNGQIANIKVIKPIAWGFSVSGANIEIRNHFVDAAPDDGTQYQTTSFPSNTDGIGISGTNITVDGYYGHNGDDCINILDGGYNIVAKNGYCGFASHGLSIGSLGKDGSTASVANVLFQNWTMDNAVYAARFKSWTGGSGQTENVTWMDIQAINVTTAICITQHYYDSNKGSSSNGSNGSSTKIKNFHFANIFGSLGPNRVHGSYRTDSIVLDLYSGTATSITFGDVKIHPYNLGYSAATVICDPDVFTTQDLANLGFACKNGLYDPTK